MSLTYDQAVDEILVMLKASWDTTGYPVIYENVAADQPSTITPYLVVTLRHATGEQASLANDNGVKRFRRDGLCVAQIRVPAGEGLSNAYSLAKIVGDAFEGKASPGGIWFRDIRINEVGPDGEWFQINTLFNFTYDEVK